MVLGKPDIHVTKDCGGVGGDGRAEWTQLADTKLHIQKNKRKPQLLQPMKINSNGLKCEAWSHEVTRRNHTGDALWLGTKHRVYA